MLSSCCWRSRRACSASPFSIAGSSAAPSALTSSHSSCAFCSSSGPRIVDTGWLMLLTMLRDVEPGGDRLDERAGIDRRVEQRELAHDALDVHAVADLEQPVRRRGPSTPSSWSFCGMQKYSVRPMPNTAPSAPLAARVAARRVPTS